MDPDSGRYPPARRRPVRPLWFDGVEVAATGARLCRGWHAPEPGPRWTDGEALLEVSGVGVVQPRLAASGLRYTVPPVTAAGMARLAAQAVAVRRPTPRSAAPRPQLDNARSISSMA